MTLTIQPFNCPFNALALTDVMLELCFKSRFFKNIELLYQENAIGYFFSFFWIHASVCSKESHAVWSCGVYHTEYGPQVRKDRVVSVDCKEKALKVKNIRQFVIPQSL